MKERFIIKERIADQVTYYHLLVFAMALPFDRFYSELALISLAVHTLIHLRKVEIQKVKLSAVLMPAAIYLLTILGTAYTKFYDEAFFEWERQLAILLFPLIILYNGFDFRKYVLHILIGLAASCFLALVYLYYNAFAVIIYSHLPLASIYSNAFINHNFSAPIDMHATYFSMYIALGAVTLICLLLRAPGKNERWIYLVMLVVLLTGLLQLTSRAVLIAFAVIVNVVIPFLYLQKKRRAYFLIASLLVSVSVFFALTQIDNLKTRFIVDLKEDLTQVSVTNNTLEPRVTRWECAWQLIKNSPVYGNGSGSEVALLKEIYYQRKLYNSYIHELNAHNQYLSMLVKTGVIGLAVLLYLFFAGFKKAIRSRDAVFCGFMVIIAVVSFSENILDANKGIFFFAFFYSLFYLAGEKPKMGIIQK
jgi:O-antigen ligase